MYILNHIKILTSSLFKICNSIVTLSSIYDEINEFGKKYYNNNKKF